MIEHMLEEGGLASSDDQGIKKDTLVLPILYTNNDISSIKFDYTTLDNKVMQEKKDVEPGLLDFDTPYEENELIRPFSENYNLDTLDFVAMKKIARGEYQEFDSVKFAQENYDSNYEYNEATNDAYFRIDIDDEKETAAYEKTKEETEELQSAAEIAEEIEETKQEEEETESSKAEESEEEKTEQESPTKINPVN